MKMSISRQFSISYTINTVNASVFNASAVFLWWIS